MPGFDAPLVLRVAEIAPERSTCGFRQRLAKAADGVPASVTYLRVHCAECHYHNHTTEYYYVLGGSGTLRLDDEEVPLEPNTLVCIPPGVRHSAHGELTVLVIGVPPFTPDDQIMG